MTPKSKKPKPMSNEDLFASEGWLTTLKWKLVMIFLFPVYTMMSCYTIFWVLLYQFPPLRIPLLTYYAYICFFDKAPGYGWSFDWWPYDRIEKCRNFWGWRLGASYWPNSKLIKTVDLDPSFNYLFLYHPHGIISMAMQAGMATQSLDWLGTFPGIQRRVCTLVANFKFPFFREVLLANGYLDCNRSTIKRALSKKGENLVLVPGGAHEALYSHPGTLKLHLLKRFGFVKVALQTGASLVPCLGFGENDMFETIDNQSEGLVSGSLYKMQVWMMKKMSFSMPLMTHFFPKRVSLFCVVGRPIHLRDLKCDEPSVELVRKVHGEYVEALKALYEEYKEEYGNGVELELV